MENKGEVKIYIVEDDPMFSKMLAYVLSMNPEHKLETFKSANSLLRKLHDDPPSIITIDYSLPDMSGEELLAKVKLFDPEIPAIIISGQDEIKTAVNLLKEGAYDYITKSEDIKERLLNSINNAKKNISLRKEVSILRQELREKYDFSKTIVGQSPAIKRVYDVIGKSLSTNINVSITGETGTGKEVVAKAIHFNSPRKNKPFVAVNIAAIPEQLLESELFGHEKGAFTGAIARKAGKFEEADQGSIFLDEIGEMDINLQAKLLRVLQERELVRIGGNEVIKLDVRIITATHRNLLEEVKKGTFREDLYYRLLGLPIELPPLRDRNNDALIIAKFFLNNFCKENDLPEITLAKDAVGKLLDYDFPGNIRELKAVIELAAVMCTDNIITADDITFRSLRGNKSKLNDELTLKEHTLNIVNTYLKKHNGNIVKSAKALGIGKSTLYRYLKEMEDLGVLEKG